MAPGLETMKIHHVSLANGEAQVSPDTPVNGTALALVMPWLDQMLANGARRPLAFADVSHFSPSAEEYNDALFVTLWRPLGTCRPGSPYRGKAEMLSAFRVAPDKAGCEIFWTSLRATRVARAPQRQPVFWSQGLPLDTGSAVHAEALGWLPDLQNAIASSWLRRTTELRSGMVVRFRTS
jgi:hypothetical protein